MFYALIVILRRHHRKRHFRSFQDFSARSRRNEKQMRNCTDKTEIKTTTTVVTKKEILIMQIVFGVGWRLIFIFFCFCRRPRDHPKGERKTPPRFVFLKLFSRLLRTIDTFPRLTNMQHLLKADSNLANHFLLSDKATTSQFDFYSF